MKQRLLANAVVASIPFLITACVNAQNDYSTPDEQPGKSDGAEETYDAIGFILAPENPENPTANRQWCSGTLITPSKVLTARHCIMEAKKGEFTFAIGNRTDAAIKSVNISSAEVFYSGGQAGAKSEGRDFAVLNLETPIVDVVPIPVADFSAESIGRPMQFAGFGRDSSDFGKDGLVIDPSSRNAPRSRHIKDIVLSMQDGKPLERLFGSFAGFQAAAPEWFPRQSAPQLESEYNESLRKDYEAAAIELGEGKSCHGDSGGPLLRNVNDQVAVVGVVSRGIHPGCKLGDIFAITGQESAAFIRDAVANTNDVCAGESEQGRCEGSVGIVCDLRRGPKHVYRIDCAASGKTCAVDAERGSIDCVAPN
jgi:hypothetical protein